MADNRTELLSDDHGEVNQLFGRFSPLLQTSDRERAELLLGVMLED
jgi:hypothetical protein